MANVLAPFGFSVVETAGGPVNYSSSSNPPYRIRAGNSTAIFFGDLVRYGASSDAGYMVQWANGDGSTTQQAVGIFIGCKYYSTSQRKTVWNNYWPGSDATGDVEAYVVDDPNTLFKVQSGYATAAITQTSQGLCADIVASPTGSTTTGISGMSLAQPTASSPTVLPFKVWSVVTSPSTANGTDLTTAYNYLIVSFNNQIYKSLQAV